MDYKDYIEIRFSGTATPSLQDALAPILTYFQSRGISKLVSALLVDADENIIHQWNGELALPLLNEALSPWQENLAGKTLRFRCFHGATNTLCTLTIPQQGEPDFPMPLSYVAVNLSDKTSANYTLHGRSVGHGVLPQTAPQNGILLMVILAIIGILIYCLS